MLCVLCSNYIPGYGNNAQPVAEGICCDSCNLSVVLKQRLRHAPLSHATELNGSVATLSKLKTTVDNVCAFRVCFAFA